MIYIANYGTPLTTAQADALNSLVALGTTPAGSAITKDGSGNFVNTVIAGGGTVTSVSVVSANGFAGSVATATTTPAITLSTTITGILKGNGTAISAASAGTDYEVPLTFSTGLTRTTNTITVNTSQNISTLSNLTSNGLVTTSGGTGALSITVPGTGILTFLATPSSANLLSAVTDETGSGLLVFNNTPTLTTPVLNGTPTGTGVATAATASTLALRNSNGNLTMVNALEGYTTTATAGGTTTLTVSSNNMQYFTGSSNQTVQMPVTSTLVLGQSYWIVNLSTGSITVNSSGSNAIVVVAAGCSAELTCILTSGTTASSWNAQYFADIVASGKKLNVSNSITLAGTDATTMTFPTTSKTIAANDGSNWTFGSQAIGDIVYASSTTAFTRLAAVAVGQVLVSAGTGTAPAYSANPQVTTVELGNASDTTLARVAAGMLSIEGEVMNGYTTTATAAGTTTLTITSTKTQFFTGSSTQTVKLPTTSVIVGQTYIINNQSTGNVTVQSSGANTIVILGSGMSAMFTALVATPTTAANWTYGLEEYIGLNNAITASANAATIVLAYKTNTVTNNSAATLTITIPTAGAVDGETRIVRVLDFSAVAQTITWVNTENSTITAPTTSNGSTTLPITVGFQYNNGTSKWRCIASA